MSAGQYNFLVEQGATCVKQFINLDLNGNQIPLPAGTGALFSIKIAPATITSANIILARSNDARLTLNTTGIVTLTLSSNDTENILGTNTNYVYDLFLIFPSGTVVKFLTGSITVLASVTHV